MKFDIAPIRRDRNALESELRRGGVEMKGKTCRCPWHGDQHPSAGIYEREGVWRFHCHVCDLDLDIIDVRAKFAGSSVEEEIRKMLPAAIDEEKKPPHIFPTIEAMLESIRAYSNVEARYEYGNPDTGGVELIVVRCRDGEHKKHFLQARPAHGGGFAMKSPEKPWPLYNRSRVRNSDRVIVGEGEKVVHAFHDAGIVATTSPAGAGKAAYADWSPMAGKQVYLWPDNDAAGVAHMKDVAAELQKLMPVPLVHWIEPSNLSLPDKGDVVEYLAIYEADTKEKKRQAIECVLQLATSFGPSAQVQKLIDATIAGERYSVPLPWSVICRNTNALLPGTVTAICGDPGTTKSFWVLQAARFWLHQSIKFALYQLEADEEGSHLLRALAQESNCPDLLEWRWTKDNPDTARDLMDRNRQFLDAFGARLWTPPAEPPHLTDLSDWVRDRAKEGCRVIVVDPITAADTSAKRWDDDRHFVISGQKIMRDYKSSLVLVSHPKLGTKTGTMADLAGGAAFSRFTQTVLWFKLFEPAKEMRIKTPVGERLMSINRSIKISKSRLGRGGGSEIGYWFGGGMVFSEQGVVVRERHNGESA